MCNSGLSNDIHQSPLKLLGVEIFPFKKSHDLIYTLYTVVLAVFLLFGLINACFYKAFVEVGHVFCSTSFT